MEEDYDLLVAADGVGSNVRKRLLESEKNFSVSVSPNRLKHIGVPGLVSPHDNSKGSLAAKTTSHSYFWSEIYSEITAPGWMSFIALRTPNGTDKQDFGVMAVSMPKEESVYITFSAPPLLFEQIRKGGKEWIYDILPEKFPLVMTSPDALGSDLN